MGRALLFAAVVAAVAEVVAVAACGSNASNPAQPGPDGGTLPDAGPSDAGAPDSTAPDAQTPDASPPPLDAGPCPPPPDGGLWPFEGPANGSFLGPGVDAILCNAGASLFTNDNGTFLKIPSYQGVTSFDFATPTAAEYPLLTVLLPAGTTPGVYTSSAPINCGNAGFSYALPPPPGLDCDGGGPPPQSPSGCPAGCTTACSGFGCEPCTPNPPSYFYGASGETGGICAEVYPQPGTLTGSWRITLTSVTAFEGDAGGGSPGTPYTVHGTLSAEMLGGGPDGGLEQATLSLAF